MLKVIILSDTHMPKRAKKLPEKLIAELPTANFIIHAGDWQTMDVFEELSKYAPVDGVAGNVDHEAIINKFGYKKILLLGGKKIGVVHGHGKGKTTEKRAVEAFENDDVDVIIYGHSHIPVKKVMEDVHVFNPGSPTDKRRQAQYSYGVMTITSDGIFLDHVFFDDKS